MKLKDFFDVLKKNLVIEYFTDESYQMLVTIPELYVYKSEQDIWLVEIWIAEGLFEYLHPFIFPDFFRKKLTEDEFKVLFEILTIFSSNFSTQKEFNLQKFFNSYSSNINGTRQKNIKEFFIKYLKILREESKIRDEILFSSSSLDSKKIDQLIPGDLSPSKQFSVFESIDVNFK